MPPWQRYHFTVTPICLMLHGYLQRRETWRLTECRPTTTRSSEAGAHSASRCDCARSLQAGGNNPEASRTSGPGNRSLSVDSNLQELCPMKTYVAKPGEVEKKWILIDADGLVVGRLAALIATAPQGQAQGRSTRRTSTAATTSSSSTPRRSSSPATSTTTRSITGTPAIPAASRSARRARSSRASSPSASWRRPSSACSSAAPCSAS